MFNNYYSPLEEDNERYQEDLHPFFYNFTTTFIQFDSIFLLQFDH